MKARTTERSVEAAEHARFTELEEANADLRAELAVARAKVTEVESRENNLISS
jgi:hypothetical protein